MTGRKQLLDWGVLELPRELHVSLELLHGVLDPEMLKELLF